MAGPASLAAWTAGLAGAKRAAAGVFLGAVSVLAFAPFHIWPVLFVSLGGLVWLLDGCYRARATRAARLSCAALSGFWFGFGFFLTGLYWVAEAFLVEPWRHGWLIPVVMTALPAGMALFFVAGCTVAMALWRPGPARIFALAIGLGLSEYARGHVLTGLPWNLIGYGLLANAPLMQLAALFGVYAATVFAVALFAAPAAIWNGGGARSRGALLAAGLLLVLLGTSYVWGEMRLAATGGAPAPLRVRLVQANIDQAEKWRPENATRIFETHLDMTDRPGLEAIDIVVWPETALPFPLDTSPDARAAVGAMLPGDTVLLVGSARWTEQRNARGILLDRHAFNSLMTVDSEGRVVSVYDKIHLVPFGEFLPFQDALESLGVMQMTGVRGGFTEGAGPRLLDVPGAPPALPLICYEIIFPDEVRPPPGPRSADAWPGWMLNVTNDAWFGSSAGPYQHFHQARVRAVELGLPLIRVANTGISAVVDPWGRILAEIGLDTQDTVDANLPKAGPVTPYALWGPWMVVLALGTAVLGWLVCRKRIGSPRLTGQPRSTYEFDGAGKLGTMSSRRSFIAAPFEKDNGREEAQPN